MKSQYAQANKIRLGQSKGRAAQFVFAVKDGNLTKRFFIKASSPVEAALAAKRASAEDGVTYRFAGILLQASCPCSEGTKYDASRISGNATGLE